MAVGSALCASRFGQKRLIKTAISPQHRGKAELRHRLSRGLALCATECVSRFVWGFSDKHFTPRHDESRGMWGMHNDFFFSFFKNWTKNWMWQQMNCADPQKTGNTLALQHESMDATSHLRVHQSTLSVVSACPWHGFLPVMVNVSQPTWVTSAGLPVPPYGPPSVHHLAHCSFLLYGLHVFLGRKESSYVPVYFTRSWSE